MKILVTGAGGMLGTDVCAEIARRGHDVIRTGRGERDGFVSLDITDTRKAVETIRREAPDTIIHCAAWTDVDGAERTPDPAYRVNALGSWNLAHAAGEAGTWLIGVSTDFVFDGKKITPYTEFDVTNPLGAYGASKQAGEVLIRETLPGRHMIVRTSWLFGVHGKNFPYTIRRLAEKLPEVPVVSDQVGSPTHTRDLARKLVDLAEDPLPGTYHIASAGECSWFEFAQAITAAGGFDTPVVPITAQMYADRFNSPTKRPAYSVMDHLALRMRGMDDLPHWRDALADFLALVPADR
ncbi:MAG: dTDP-4-dehydrorhamnose reductase [Akkermansiaceae bacterium]|nr:dTDP-4-dehydrorhamnose reductase [Armatimonadota bacterium]